MSYVIFYYLPAYFNSFYTSIYINQYLYHTGSGKSVKYHTVRVNSGSIV